MTSPHPQLDALLAGDGLDVGAGDSDPSMLLEDGVSGLDGELALFGEAIYDLARYAKHLSGLGYVHELILHTSIIAYRDTECTNSLDAPEHRCYNTLGTHGILEQ